MKKPLTGLRLDERPLDSLPGSHRDARNIIIKDGYVKNEGGFTNSTPSGYPAAKRCIGVIPTNTVKVFFFATTSASDSEIGIVSGNTYTPIIKDALLNFHQNHPIQGAYQYKYNGNLIIAWTDSTAGKWNEYRILNVDCPPFGIHGTTYAITEPDKFKALIKLFPDVASPIVADLSVEDNGGAVKTGAWYPIISYRLKDNTTTGWVAKFNPVSIVLDPLTTTFNDYDGDASGITTSKKIKISLSDVDENYDYLRLGMIHLQAGTLTAYYVTEYKIAGNTLEVEFLNSESTITQITLDEVLVPNAAYPFGKTITTLLSKLFLGDVEINSEIAYQPYANSIGIEWITEDDIDFQDNLGTSYKDSSVIFFDKSFRSDEVYAFYIAFKLKDGTYSKAFHIPGRALIAGDDTVINNTETNFLKTGGIKKFQAYDTALSDGTMGYWENENENYPNNTTDFPTLANTPVRHHKFPSLKSLKEWGEHFIYKPALATGGSAKHTDVDVTGVATVFAGTDRYFYPTYTVGTNTFGFISATPGNGTIQLNANAKDAAWMDYNININIAELRNDVNPNLTATVRLEIDVNPGLVPAPYSGSTSPNLLDFTQNYTFANTGGTGNLNLNFNLADILLQLSNISPDTINIFMEVRFSNYVNVDPNPPTANFNSSTFDFDKVVLNPKTRKLGIRVSNVNIPSGIVNKVDTWEIFYAKRTNGNITAIGQDIIREDRYHSFDLLNTQASLRASYLKPLLDYQRSDANASVKDTTKGSGGFEMYESYSIAPGTEELYAIDEFFYVGEDTLTPIDNTGKSTSIYITTHTALGGAAGIATLMDLCIYREDAYKFFYNQELVSTGQKFKAVTGIQATKDIYGGDVFVNQYGFIEHTTNFNEYLELVESVSNIGLRMDDEESGKYYYPKHSAAGTPLTPPTISYYGYNSDYSALNIEKVFPYQSYEDDCITDVTKFPQKIPFSIDDGNEALTLGWRIFKANDYYEMPKDKGGIWNLLGNDRTLYIHMEYTLYLATVKDTLATTEGQIYLGVNTIFDRPPVEALPVKEGYAGTQSQFACIACKLGYCFLDRNAGKVFILPFGSIVPKEISEQGMFNWWKTNGQQVVSTTDNPFAQTGYWMVYDDFNNRLIIGKRDNSVDGEVRHDKVISYSPELNNGQGGWVAFHDYAPHFMFSNREALWVVRNDLPNNAKLYKHNSTTVKATFFSTVQSSYIDIPFNEENEITKTFAAVKWLSEIVTNAGITLENKTLTHLMVYNANQCSGRLDIYEDLGLWFGHDRRNNEETWQFNNFRDVVNNSANAFLDSNGAVIGANINFNKAWFKKHKFLSKFVIVRFEYDNVDQNDFYLLKVGVNARPSNR